MAFHVPNKYRIHEGRLATTDQAGNNGAFDFPPMAKGTGRRIFVVAGDSAGWEHVSVSVLIWYMKSHRSLLCFVMRLPVWFSQGVGAMVSFSATRFSM